nr:unnamed protein product [Haemonchus contortus]
MELHQLDDIVAFRQHAGNLTDQLLEIKFHKDFVDFFPIHTTQRTETYRRKAERIYRPERRTFAIGRHSELHPVLAIQAAFGTGKKVVGALSPIAS